MEHIESFLLALYLKIVHVKVYVVLLGVQHMCYHTFRGVMSKL